MQATALHPLSLSAPGGALRVRPYAPRARFACPSVWALRLVAVQVALTLGLLSPLLCVLHCAFHDDTTAGLPGGRDHHAYHGGAAAQRLGGHHDHGGAASHHRDKGEGAASAALSCALLQDQAGVPAGDALPAPRALYELVGAVAILIVAATIAGTLVRHAPALPRFLAPAPPIPPPRPSKRLRAEVASGRVAGSA